MGSELDITAREVDIDRFVTAMRAAAMVEDDLVVSVTEVPFSGDATTLWGRVLPSGDEDLWSEAQDEADQGLATIETITPPDRRTFDCVVYHTDHRERVLQALRERGQAIFHYATTFVIVDITWRGTHLALGFDRTTRATGHPDFAAGGESAVTFIATSDNYVGRGRDGSTAQDHIRAVKITDILAEHAVLDRYDTSGYAEHRDEIALISAMAIDRQFRADMKAVYGYESKEALKDVPLSVRELRGVFSPTFTDPDPSVVSDERRRWQDRLDDAA